MKISIFIILTAILCNFNSVGLSNTFYDDNLNIRQAHQYLYSLRPLSAEKILQSEAMKNPDNGYITFYRLYSEIITLVISNSPEQYRKRVSVLKARVRKLEELPDNAPDYRLLLGESKVFTGLLNVKYNSKIGGLMECLRGYNLLKENHKKFPLFRQDDKIPGMIQICVAFMPKVLRWGVKLLGITSDPQAGLSELANYSAFAKGKPGYEEEAFLFTMAAHKLMNQEEAAMRLIFDKKVEFKEILLLNYIAATICLEANDAETALLLLSNMAMYKQEIPFPPLNYLLGKAKLMRLDPDANVPLLSYLQNSIGADYLKATLYDLACFYYVVGNEAQYRDYIGQVKSKGRELHNRDIEAAFEANKPGLPNVHLMRADFLVRGGYYLKAMEELSKTAPQNQFSEEENIWFHYLSGECERLRNEVKQAEQEYLMAIAKGENTGNYITQKAMVQAGMMMEKRNFKAEAEKYYNLCLRFKASDNPYSDLFNNKARAGIIRLSLSE